jgi:flagellar hook-associated protein 1 FlgK
MSGITAAINTALTGLNAFQAGIDTVSNNLANQATPGYAVETVSTSTLVGQAGQPGAGVQAPLISRAANGFAAGLLNAANAASQAASTQSTQLTAISNALQNNGDVQTSINQFFLDVSSLAANPTSAGLGQTVLGDAQTVVGSFQTAASAINTTLKGAAQTVTQNVASANTLLAQLATINKSLTSSPNEVSLLDQQQAALTSLSQLLPVSTIAQSNGGVIVNSGGTVLVDQSGPQTLNVTAGTATSAPVVTAGTNDTPVSLGGADGSIGGAITSYSAGLSALSGLNALAAVFASAVNTAQAQGLTTTGASGGALFSVPAPSVTASASNTGTATVSALISNASALPTDGGPFLLTYSGSTWTAIDQASGQAYTGSGNPPSFAGLTLSIAGSPNNGDQFTLNPAPDAATGIAVAASSPAQIAAADPYVLNPGTLQSSGAITDSNAGTLSAGADGVTSSPASTAAIIPDSFYGQSLQLTFTSATDYTVSTSADPSTAITTGSLTNSAGYIAVAYPSTGAAAGTYWQLPVTGTPVSGDTYTLSTGGGSSGSNASRIAALWSGSNNTSAGTLQNAFVSFSTGLGANAAQAQQLATTTAGAVTSATNTLQAISGVNTDQQAVVLTQYSQAYQAAAQVISTAHSIFESLLQAV